MNDGKYILKRDLWCESSSWAMDSWLSGGRWKWISRVGCQSKTTERKKGELNLRSNWWTCIEENGTKKDCSCKV